jgi:hypothetical protein
LARREALGILPGMPRTLPTRGIVLALILMLAVVAACDAQATPSSSPVASGSAAGECTPEEVAGGGISGRVVNEAGEPLDDILVLIETVDFHGDVRTGEDGLFSAPGVSGRFVISTVDIDHQETRQEVTVPCGELVEVELVLTPIGG